MNKIIISSALIFILSYQVICQSAAERFNRGMKAFDDKDYVEANQFFDSFFSDYNEIDELYATAKYYSGESLLNLGETHAAKERFEFFVNNYKWSTFRDLALYKLGMIYFALGEFEKSRDRFNILVKEYIESQYFGPALYWIGESYVEERDIDFAIKYLEDAVSKRKDNKYIDYSIYSLANVHERKGNFKKAVDYYDQLLSYYKESKFIPIAQFRIAYCYFNLKEYNSAIIELNNPVIKTLPPDLYNEAIFLLANSHYRLSEFRKAEEICQHFVLNNPSSDLIIDIKYCLAWSYFQQEKYFDAYEVFNSLSSLDDSIGINSFYWKAEAIWCTGNTDEALSIFKKFIQVYPESELVSKVKYQVGSIYYNSNNIYDSKEYLLEAINSENSIVKSKAYLMLGEMNLNEQKFALAEDNFRAALSLADSLSDIHSNALLGLSISLFQQQQFNEAIKNLIDLETKDVNFSLNKVNFYLAESYFAKGSFSEAVKRYNEIDKDDKELGPLSQYGKGYAYFNLKDYENAISAFSDFIKNNPTNKRNLDARLRLADSYYGNKNYASAGKIYKQIYVYNGDKAKDPYVQYQYAQALYKGGNSSEAISEFRKLQSAFPESEYADKSLFAVGWIFFQQNSYTDAINSYRTLLSIYPNSSLNPIVLYSIGDAFFNQNKFDSAIVSYQKVIDRYPTSNYVFDAVNGIQYCYVAQNKDEKAISLIEDFVRKNPNLSFSDQIYFKKGEIYYGQGNYEKAKSSYKEFTSRYPRSELAADAYYWIGKSAQNLNQFDEATFNYNKVFESYPGSNLSVASVIEMGNIYNLQKKYDLALGIYSRGIDKLSNSPQIAEILFMKATTLVNKGDINAAYEVFDDIVQYHPETVFADQSKFEIGLIEYIAKRYDNAILYFRSISENRTDELGAEAQYYLGMSLFEQEKINEAISAFVRVRTIFSYYDEWLSRSNIMLGDCYKKLKDYDKAKQFYRDVIAKHQSDEIGKTAQKKLREID